MMLRLLILSAFVILFSCNSADGDASDKDSVNIDTLYPLPFDSNASGADTSDHNQGNAPTNHVDVGGPVVKPKAIPRKFDNKPKSPKNPHFDTTKS